ncbi:hypothetical protein GGI15_001968 [Coemansia interrupta]|uniref:DUF1168-domain-containing protein n=1 Tax=Coemansia interrupta TaxID=1126814 RepID=A0A9W8HKP2_9FUNG|nr:hypothetical protein GGI15_001968 [Coemansia interrupta]
MTDPSTKKRARQADSDDPLDNNNSASTSTSSHVDDNHSDGATVRKKPRNRDVDKQRSEIEMLMQRIDTPIDLDISAKPIIKPPREFELNVRGSSSGAGSTDFHYYQQLRRKENLRIQLIEAEAAEDTAKEQYKDDLDILKRKDNEKTAKNRAKRQKRKKNKDKRSDAK